MSVVEITDRGRVRVIRMNRPEKKNALSNELAWGVLGAVEQAAADDDVWVVCITGTGDAFSSGLDLTGGGEDASPLSPQSAFLDDLSWVGRFPLVMRQRCEKPVIAGINGVAAGAGLSLAMACDIRLVARSARLIPGYPRMGGSPDGGLTWTLSQAIGYERAMRFLLENRTIDGEEAVRIGMAGEAVDDDQFAARLDEYCNHIAQLSPIAARLTKRTVGRATTAIDVESHARFELQSIQRAFRSNDAQEARKAVMEKRTPVFEGR